MTGSEQFDSVSKRTNRPLHASLPNTREIFVTARSNAATSGSISVQIAIIVSLQKITK
jgi:hypothetical protein